MAPLSRSSAFPRAPLRSSSADDGIATVFIVDDDVSVRESLEALIRLEGWQAASFASAQEFLSRRRTQGARCLVLDVTLPDLNGLELQERVALSEIGMPIIVITGHGDIPMSVRAMKAGATEFLTKPFDRDVLLGAIRAALSRSRKMQGALDDLRTLRARYDSLSPREQQVMALVTAGRLNKQVGSELGISEITVKAHRGRVMRKMQARSLPDLVLMAESLRSDDTRD